MSTPPRRRRRPDDRSSKSGGDGGGWLPTIAMGLGVIVAGLGIGALVAVVMQRNSGTSPPVATITSTAVPSSAPERPPVAIATFEPPRTPRPSPTALALAPRSPSPAPSVSREPSALPTATAEPSPTVAPAVVPVPVPAASVTPARVVLVAPSPATSTSVTTTPSAQPSGTPPPTPAPAVQANPTAVVATPAGALPTTQSAYEEHASAVVRRYVDALIRGDEKTAYSALGGSSGTLSEQAFLDPSARIVSLKVTRVDASNATVGCEIASAKGHFYATYHVTAATSGPYISAHDYIKVST